MEEAHIIPYALQSGIKKIYCTLKTHYWWPTLKKNMVEYISKCLAYQQIKDEHQALAGKLRSLPLFEWKWEHITIDFNSGLPGTRKRHGVIWVIVDSLTKSAHFLPIKWGDSLSKLAIKDVDEIIDCMGCKCQLCQISLRFTSHVWQILQKALGTKLHFSMGFHPHIDRQFERTIQILEDMLQAYTLEF